MTTIKYRFLLNHAVDFRDGGALHQPEVRFIEKHIPSLVSGGRPAVVSIFDIGPESKVKTIVMRDEDVKYPSDYDSLPEPMKRAVEESVVKAALEAREANREIRDAVDHYVAQGVIALADEVAA
jgi:hypothetical protein